ncbi:FtsK/SpoIIIE domain-containing protein [Isoptericola aurantiacus]|uniref:FtsK/SpoIIIE domain-containing protein n=1 Tax=Isoptericola aurantiacus TaxID=3377839 RepID=UPI00383BB172
MPVRLTLHPDEDVELPAGARLGDLRAALAELARRPELLHCGLTADGAPVGDDARVGLRPLLPGAVLRTVRPTSGPAGAAPDVAALRSRRFVAAATGPAAGEPSPLVPGAPLRLGPAADAVTVRVDARDRVRVRRSPAVSASRGTPRGRTPVLVRPADGAAGRPRARRRRLGLLPRRWHVGTLLDVAGTRYALHASGDVAAWLAAETADPPAAPAPGPAVLATGLVPVIGSVALAVAFRQPLYALFSVVAVVALIPQVLAARRRRRAGSEPAAGTAVPPAGTDPARTALRVVAAHQASDGAWRRSLEVRAARSAARGADSGPATRPRDLLPDGALAVRGAADPVRAAARAVVVDLAAAGARVAVAGTRRDAWTWARWSAEAPAAGSRDPDPVVLVVDGPDADSRAAADAAARRGDVVVLCLPDAGPGAPEPAAPAWCRAVLRLLPDGRALRTAPDGTDTLVAPTGVTEAWAERTARRLAGLRGLSRCLGDLEEAERRGPGLAAPSGTDATDPTDPRLPATVPLAGLVPADDPGRRWAAATGWAVPLGRDAAGEPVTVDLVADGPHLLVAGTTGAGKSELLQSLVLGLALTRSPADLALALVDFKGGASFGRCADLPHVVGQVTDLEAGLAGRALAGLRAELRRRERVLAEHRAAALDDAPPGTLPRLVVVIDEFRALADDLPEFLPGLLRVAAQGRSLGVHLVLATQRPAGAVSTDVRANVSTRIALRVVDTADSHDVVETAAAARIPVDRPGRAVLRVGAAPPVVLQCAHAGAAPDGGESVVRRVPHGHRPGTDATSDRDVHGRGELDGGTGREGPGPTPAGPSRGPVPADPVAATVAAVRRAAARIGHHRGPAPWLDPLPERVTGETLPSDVVPTGHVGGIPLALAEDPDHQRRSLVHWRPEAGHLAVLGRTRSGRTTALEQLATAALDQGRHVHALVPASAAPRFARLADHPCFGTLAGPEDPRRARRLLHLLTRGHAGRAPTLVVVDGVAELRAALAGAEPWDPLTTALADAPAAFAVTSDSASVGGLAARTGPRLILLSTDQHADVMLGAPSALAGRGGPPGRGAWLCSDEPPTCQVLLPGDPVTDRPGLAPDVAPVVVRPLPDRVLRVDVEAEELESSRAGTGIVIGVGGDGADPVRLEVAGGALVAGPRGSGRTTLLRAIARGAAQRGVLAAVLARDPDLRSDAGTAAAGTHAPSAVRALVEELVRRHTCGSSGTEGAGVEGRPVVVVDDLDALAQSCPVEVDRLGSLGTDGAVSLVAACTVQSALMAHRGPLAELRGLRTGVVLAAGERGADDVFGVPLSEVAEPGPPRPGRGALVQVGRAVPVQTVAV